MSPSIASATGADFWSASHRGREIAARRHGRGWLVYLDNVLLPHMLFLTAEDAAEWLRRKVDGHGRDHLFGAARPRHPGSTGPRPLRQAA